MMLVREMTSKTYAGCKENVLSNLLYNWSNSCWFHSRVLLGPFLILSRVEARENTTLWTLGLVLPQSVFTLGALWSIVLVVWLRKPRS